MYISPLISYTKYMKRKFITNYILCGILGWCFECTFTGLISLFGKKDPKMTSKTSLWMFFIYGFAALIQPASKLLNHTGTLIRGGIYTISIFFTEFTTGILLKKIKACPWDYSGTKLNIKGVIRLDYAPLWFMMGLFYEKLPSLFLLKSNK